MPLDDSELTRGKCGFKMIQYMAVGIPVLSSAVGANPDIFRDSGAGILVQPGEDWGTQLRTLMASREQFREMGAAGRAHVIRHYSIPAVIDDYVRIFESLVGGATRPL